MKRLALLLASVAVFVTACNKTDEDFYYSEEIALAISHTQRDTTYYFTQEFTMAGNTITYNPYSQQNTNNSYIWFERYGGWGMPDRPICTIIHDTIVYVQWLNAHGILNNYVVTPRAKVEKINKHDFRFSYILDSWEDGSISATHTCHRIKSLSE